MPDDSLSLQPVYAPGGALCGEPPLHWRVTAHGGAIVIDVPDEATARRWLAYYSTEEA